MKTKKPSSISKKLLLGWREWASLPELGIPLIKVKIDTGAKTSALHAFNIRPFQKEGTDWVRFSIHPLQRNKKIRFKCEAEVIDTRIVKSSNGQKEKRYVIRCPIGIGTRRWDIDITLTNRDIMSYRMLLGREAMRKLLVEPSRSFCQGRIKRSDAIEQYKRLDASS